jgi:hypothetical protein
VAFALSANIGPDRSGTAPPAAPAVRSLDVESARAGVAVLCERAVRERLKAPRSADFPRSHMMNVVSAGPNTFQLASYVDAQNAFGANLRTAFVCAVRFQGSDENDPQAWELVSLDFQQR